MMNIVGWSVKKTTELKEDFKKIFFLCTSRKSFNDDLEKQAFLDRWTAYYFDHCPDEIFFAVDEKGKTAGYLTGCEDSARAKQAISEKLPSYLVFESEFEQFPAHLHINCHPNFQGQGIGRKLVDHYCQQLQQRGIQGLHIVTSPDSPNRRFYERLGFDYTRETVWRDYPMLFMGKKL